MEVQTTDEPRQRRSDARRNIDAILDAAGRLLARDPSASMQEIAVAAGVHRATVHRHFASKDDLVRAVRERALESFIELLEEHAAMEGSPGEVLRAATRAALVSSERYRVWRYTPSFDDLSDARAERFGSASAGVLAPAHAAGLVRRDLPVEQVLLAWGGMILVVSPQIAAGALTIDQATDFILLVIGPPRS